MGLVQNAINGQLSMEQTVKGIICSYLQNFAVPQNLKLQNKPYSIFHQGNASKHYHIDDKDF